MFARRHAQPGFDGRGASRIQPDLTVVGPELPLTLGVVDEFQRRGWPIFGPTQAAAKLESSKSFAKEFMQRHRIPTAHYAICQSVDEVRAALSHFHAPIVVKADGLAAGKGVVIAKSREEAASTASDMLSGKMLGEAGSLVVLEECLKGDELSFLVFSDGERVVPLVAAQDHKRVGDGDTGPNTGGMGAYSTQTIVDDKMRDWLVHHIAQPVVAGMKAEGAEYQRRALLRLDDDRARPHGAGVQLPLRRSGDATDPDAAGKRPGGGARSFGAGPRQRRRFSLVTDASVCVVMASGGYPGTFEAGKKIAGLEEAGGNAGRKGLSRGHQRARRRVLHARVDGAGSNSSGCRSCDGGAKCLRGGFEDRFRGHALPQRHRSASFEEVIRSHFQVYLNHPRTITEMSKPLVSIVMGSDSDLEIMREAGKALEEFGIAYEIDVTSAHRSPDRTADFARKRPARAFA